MAKIDMRHHVDAHGGALFVRVAVCADGRMVKGVQGPMTIAEARAFRDDLDVKIKEAECQPPNRIASSAKTR